MRLFLYLLALVAGLSPAQASRVVLSEPVSVGAVSQPTAQRAAHPSLAVAAHAHLRNGFEPACRLRCLSVQPVAFAPISVRLTDRPRA